MQHIKKPKKKSFLFNILEVIMHDDEGEIERDRSRPALTSATITVPHIGYQVLGGKVSSLFYVRDAPSLAYAC